MTRNLFMKAGIFFALVSTAAVYPAVLSAQKSSSFEKRFREIMARPEYRHARFGAEFYSMDEDKVIFSWNPQELFVPGSTTKVLAVGTALELLGPDFRFHTKVYRTGAVEAGSVQGDLILVASGDPDLSNRIGRNGSMSFENEDHSYDGYAESKPVPGDPLTVIEKLAAEVARSGIRRVTGCVRVDISLFPEGARELGTGVVISPIVVNDNLVDVLVTPGANENEPPTLSISPKTAYVTISNELKTGAPGGKIEIAFARDSTRPDGTHVVTLIGSIPAGAPPKWKVYKVPVPSRFAEIVFTEALQRAGVQVAGVTSAPSAAFPMSLYRPENQVAEHISPPLKEEAKVTLKVSQNLHASMMPYLVGAYGRKNISPGSNSLQAGFDLEREMLQKADLDLTGAVQNDGAGGAALFAPDFMVRFLLRLTQRPYYTDFRKALPVLGKDGTLFNIQANSPAAGHVFAKTGTMGGPNALAPQGGIIDGKGLAGFIDTKDGRHLVFSAYINFVPVAKMDESATKMVGEALGEIAAAAYDGFPPRAGSR